MYELAKKQGDECVIQNGKPSKNKRRKVDVHLPFVRRCEQNGVEIETLVNQEEGNSP